MEQLTFTALCTCNNCDARWNEEYVHEDDVYCPECYETYIDFENVKVVE